MLQLLFVEDSLLKFLYVIHHIQLDFHFPVAYPFIEVNMESLSVTLQYDRIKKWALDSLYSHLLVNSTIFLVLVLLIVLMN